MKERLRQWLRRWLEVPELFVEENGRLWVSKEHALRGSSLEDGIRELTGRIDDLEAAYPDYKKAKAEADEKKANEIVPGFTPYTQRKRRWEAEHRKPAPKQKS